MNLTPLPAAQALDQYFLEARARLLDLAAILDRIERGSSAAALDDPRRPRLQQALDLLAQPGAARAEAVQNLFSLPYDPAWPRPTPRAAKSAREF